MVVKYKPMKSATSIILAPPVDPSCFSTDLPHQQIKYPNQNTPRSHLSAECPADNTTSFSKSKSLMNSNITKQKTIYVLWNGGSLSDHNCSNISVFKKFQTESTVGFFASGVFKSFCSIPIPKGDLAVFLSWWSLVPQGVHGDKLRATLSSGFYDHLDMESSSLSWTWRQMMDLVWPDRHTVV